MITDDKWALSVVSTGYLIPFDKSPPLSRAPICISRKTSTLWLEVQNLLSKQAVERVKDWDSPGFYSRIFLVPKKSGKLRLVIDLSHLNKFIHLDSFKMETTASIKNAIQPHDWTASIDLTDAYLHIPIHPASRKYLRFAVGDQLFQFRALPFGLNTAPLVFTRLMNVITSYLHRQNIALFPYLDDWLIRNTEYLSTLHDVQSCLRVIISVGLIPNWEKSDLIPTQSFIFIGMEFLTAQNIVRLPRERLDSLIETVSLFRQRNQCSAREFLSLLGKLSAASDLVTLGRLHLRPLQMSLLAIWRPHICSLEDKICLTDSIRSQLQWWLNRNLLLQGVPFNLPDPTQFLFTDASSVGWGGHLEPVGHTCHGVWSEEQSVLHVNILEMLAIELALVQCSNFIHHSCVLVSTDNSTVVAYLKKQGGTHSPNLCVIVWRILLWCQSQHVQLRVRHIPGKSNVLADLLSRPNKPIQTEWSLKPSIAQRLFKQMGYPSVDLFATRLNNKLPLYVSPVPDTRAFAIDAMSLDWNSLHAYAFPPFPMIPPILHKIRTSCCKILLIAPLWPQRSWFTDLIQLLVSLPVQLPQSPDLLSQTNGRFLHQNVSMLNLHAWELSNDRSEQTIFRQKLPKWLPLLEDRARTRFMTPSGQSSFVGAIDGKSIRSRPL